MQAKLKSVQYQMHELLFLLRPSCFISDSAAAGTEFSILCHNQSVFWSPTRSCRADKHTKRAVLSLLSAACPSGIVRLQVQAPSTQALKGLGGAAPSRYGSDAAVAAPATSAWGPPKGPTAPVSVPPQAPKMPSSSLAANAGSSLLSSLQVGGLSAVLCEGAQRRPFLSYLHVNPGRHQVALSHA